MPETPRANDYTGETRRARREKEREAREGGRWQGTAKADPDALVKDVITIVVQVNGKHRGNVEAGAGLDKDKIIEMARTHPKVVPHLEGKTVANTIFVPGRLVNFVVR